MSGQEVFDQRGPVLNRYAKLFARVRRQLPRRPRSSRVAHKRTGIGTRRFLAARRGIYVSSPNGPLIASWRHSWASLDRGPRSVRSNVGRRVVLRRLAFRVGRLDPLINLFAVNRDVLRSFDAETDSVATNVDHGHDDIIANDNGLVHFAGQYQHGKSLLVSHQFPEYATLSVQRVFAADTSFTWNLQQIRRQTSILLTNIPDKEIIKPHLRWGNEGWAAERLQTASSRSEHWGP